MNSTELIIWKIQNTVNIISLIAAIITCIILVGLGLFKYKLIDRVSLRLQGFIALIDIARHLAHIKTTHPNEILCRTIAFFLYFTDQLYLLLNVAIALNLQFMLINNMRPNNKLQWFYGFISVCIAAIFSSIPLAMGKYGHNPKGDCRLIDDKSRIWLHVLVVFFTFIPGTLYCLIIFILVLLKMRRRQQMLKLIRGSEINFGEDPFKFIWTLYSRVILYPFSCFITLFPYTVAMLLLETSSFIPLEFTFLYRLCRRITGTLNFVTLVCDPHCQIALQYLLESLFKGKKVSEDINNIEQSSIQLNNQPSTPYHHELEYPNGERILLQDYIRFL